jgi:hypothetical protein
MPRNSFVAITKFVYVAVCRTPAEGRNPDPSAVAEHRTRSAYGVGLGLERFMDVFVTARVGAFADAFGGDALAAVDFADRALGWFRR